MWTLNREKKKAAERSQLYLDELKKGVHGELQLFWPEDVTGDKIGVGDFQRRIWAITYYPREEKYSLWSGLSYREPFAELKEEVSLETYEQAFIALLKMESWRLEYLGYKPTSGELLEIVNVNALKPIKNQTVVDLLGSLEKKRLFIIRPLQIVPVDDWMVGTEPYIAKGQKVPYWHMR